MPPQKYFLKPTAGRTAARSRMTFNTGVKARRASRIAARSRPNARTGGFVDIENKFLDCEKTATGIASTWTLVNPSSGCTGAISVPALGDGESERDGRVYHINSIHVNGLIRAPAAETTLAPTGPMKVRILLYWDTQANAAVPAVTDICLGGKDEDILSFRNLSNSKRFIVLKDKTYTVNPTILNEGAVNSFAQSDALTQFKMNKKFKKGIKVRCGGSTANISSCQDNAIGLIAVRDDNASATPTVEYQSRIRFTG